MAFRSNFKRIASGVLNRRLNYLSDVGVLKPSVVQRKDEILELLKEKAKQISKSEMARKARVLKEYYRLEMAPPSNADEMQKLRKDLGLLKEFMKSGCYRQLTVKQAFVMILICTEVGLWFYLGETIGKMHIVGYKV